ncbi:MAG TPA: RluA family pseudouridine synthase [Burkholderiales bacterium]|nr:RluA family pseudouridine synthase [Burkholderiales bacterium]
MPEDRDGQRLDNFLARHLKGLPRGALYRLIRTGQVRVNGGRAKPDRKLSAGDTVRVPPVTHREPGEARVSEAVCRQIEAAILHQDDDLIVVDKPSGMAVHAGSGLAWGLIDAVRQLRPGKRIELVHRIDRETSGCLVLACSGNALQSLTEQFREGQVGKRYLSLLSGSLDQAVVEVDAPIAAGRQSGEKHMLVDDSGRAAVTRFTCLEQYPSDAFRACFAQAEILTGRTHQIRVHAHHLGAPLAGDRKYGRDADNRSWRDFGLKRLFLHAAEIELTTPSGERVMFSAPLPPELCACLDRLQEQESYKG